MGRKSLRQSSALVTAANYTLIPLVWPWLLACAALSAGWNLLFFYGIVDIVALPFDGTAFTMIIGGALFVVAIWLLDSMKRHRSGAHGQRDVMNKAEYIGAIVCHHIARKNQRDFDYVFELISWMATLSRITLIEHSHETLHDFARKTPNDAENTVLKIRKGKSKGKERTFPATFESLDPIPIGSNAGSMVPDLIQQNGVQTFPNYVALVQVHVIECLQRLGASDPITETISDKFGEIVDAHTNCEHLADTPIPAVVPTAAYATYVAMIVFIPLLFWKQFGWWSMVADFVVTFLLLPYIEAARNIHEPVSVRESSRATFSVLRSFDPAQKENEFMEKISVIRSNANKKLQP